MYCPVSRKTTSASAPKMRWSFFIFSDGIVLTCLICSVARGLQVCAGVDGRKRDAKRGAFARRALDGDVARVLLDDAVGDGEAQARAAPDAFGREEGVVNLGDVFGRDADARVRDFDQQRPVVRRGRRELDAPAFGNGVARVEDQIRKDLLEF